MRQPMRNHCTPRKCSRSCPHHFPTLIPNLLPHVGWAIVGSQCIQCVSDLLNEAPKVWIKLWKTAAYFTYNSNGMNKRILFHFYKDLIYIIITIKIYQDQCHNILKHVHIEYNVLPRVITNFCLQMYFPKYIIHISFEVPYFNKLSLLHPKLLQCMCTCNKFFEMSGMILHIMSITKMLKGFSIASNPTITHDFCSQ